MNTAERLSNLMLNRGINKSQLAKGSKIPYTTIDGIFKKGAHNIKLGTLIKLADYFNVSIDYLIGRTDTEFSPAEMSDIKMFEEFIKYRRSING